MATVAHLAVEVDFDVDDATAGARKVTGSIRDVERAAQTADTGIDDLGDGLTRITKNSDKSVGAVGRLGGAFNALRGAGTVGLIAAAIGALPAAAIAASGGIVLGLGGALTAVGVIGAAQSKKVKKAWTSEIESIKQTIKTISKPFEPVLVSIANMFGDTFNKFVPELKAAFKDIAPSLEGFAGGLSVALEKLQPAIKPITDAFTTLLDKLGPKLPTIFKSLADGLTAIADAIGDNPDKFVNLAVAIGKLVGWVLQAIAFITRFSNVFLGIVVVLGIVAAAFGGPVFAIAGIIAAIVALVALVAINFPAIKQFVVNTWKRIKAASIAVWNSVKTFLVNTWNRIKAIVTGAVDSVKTFLSDGWNAVNSTAKAAWNRIKNAVRDGVNRVVDLARSIPGKITGAIGNLGRLLWNAGRAVITGLVNGIKSAVGWLRDTLSWVGGLIPDWKGPLSDDRKMLQPAGAAIMSGLIDGVAAQRGALRSELAGVGSDAESFMTRAADQLAQHDLAATMRAPTPAGVSGVGGSQPMHVTLRIGDRTLGELMVDPLRGEVRKRGGDVQAVLSGQR